MRILQPAVGPGPLQRGQARAVDGLRRVRRGPGYERRPGHADRVHRDLDRLDGAFVALPRVIRVPLRARDGSVRAWALLDEQDAHLAEQRWCLDGDGYAVRTVHRPGQTKRM